MPISQLLQRTPKRVFALFGVAYASLFLPFSLPIHTWAQIFWQLTN
jgi:hypothetical protein